MPVRGRRRYLPEAASGWSYVGRPRAREREGEPRSGRAPPSSDSPGLALELLKLPGLCEAIEDGTLEGLAGGAVDSEQEVLLRARLVETTDEDRLVTRVPAESLRDLASFLVA